MGKTSTKQYKPPQDMWGIDIDFEEPLNDDDPMYVDTEKGRGEFGFRDLFNALRVDTETGHLRSPRDKSYNLFLGHRGCGKSTELRRLAKYIHCDNLFYVVFIDSVKELDINNLSYTDVVLALAKKLCEKLGSDGIKIDGTHLRKLKEWFSSKILSSEKLKDFSMEFSAGAEIGATIPLLAKISAMLTNKIKSGATYKEEIRRVVNDSYSEFALSFNQLIHAAEDALKKAGKSGKILFIIDGTDRLNDTDSQRFFIREANQLQQIIANFIYCAPIHLLYEGTQVQQWFNTFILPMIKISERENLSAPFKAGYEVLRDLVYKRADPGLFDSEEVIDLLIRNSGGNPRHLLRLLSYTLQDSNMKRFTIFNAEKAIHKLAMEYWRFLNAGDYEILYNVDHGELTAGNSPQIRNLLYNLAILEYNSGWWRAHPVVRGLDGYKRVNHEPGR